LLCYATTILRITNQPTPLPSSPTFNKENHAF
jgi:hypothetical protein